MPNQLVAVKKEIKEHKKKVFFVVSAEIAHQF